MTRTLSVGLIGQRSVAAERRSARCARDLGFGGPQPVADAVAYLLASSGDWLSGAVLNISGGELRGV